MGSLGREGVVVWERLRRLRGGLVGEVGGEVGRRDFFWAWVGRERGGGGTEEGEGVRRER